MNVGGTYWRDKKVLVTGADGFMGSHLVDKLLNLNADVSVYVRATSVSGTTCYTFKNLKYSEDTFRNIIAGNIASRDTTRLIVKDRPSVIFHLAADAYVNYSFDHPAEVKDTNFEGTYNVLEAALELKDEGLERLVCTSSSEIYGTAQYDSIDENHPLNPSSPYAASKVAADRYSYSYWNTFKIPIAIIRPFNTYGPRHTYDVIPKFINLALKGEPLTIYGSGEQSRDFTYVDDMINAFLIMGYDQKAIGEAVNFGTGVDIKIKDIAKKVIDISNSGSKIIFVEKRLAEVEKLICNCNKAKKLFNWETEIDINNGLTRNIAWTKENLK